MLLFGVCFLLCYLVSDKTLLHYDSLIYTRRLLRYECGYFMRALYKSFDLHSSFSCSMISNRSLRITRRVL